MVNIQSPTAEIRQGKKRRKKKEEERRNSMKILWPALLHRATIKMKRTDRHPFNGLFSRTTWIIWHQKG